MSSRTSGAGTIEGLLIVRIPDAVFAARGMPKTRPSQDVRNYHRVLRLRKRAGLRTKSVHRAATAGETCGNTDQEVHGYSRNLRSPENPANLSAKRESALAGGPAACGSLVWGQLELGMLAVLVTGL